MRLEPGVTGPPLRRLHPGINPDELQACFLPDQNSVACSCKSARAYDDARISDFVSKIKQLNFLRPIV